MARLNKAKEPIPLAVGSCCVSRRDAYRTAKPALPLVPQYLLDPNTPSGRYNRAQAQICAGPDTWLRAPPIASRSWFSSASIAMTSSNAIPIRWS
jgi:hypothetical protein